MVQERLHKILAHAGLGSRRACEQFIRQGRVTLNGAVIDTLGVKAEAGVDDLRLDGERVVVERALSVLLYKPAGLLCTSKDEFGRETVVDLLGGITQRLYTAGRLDKDSEGLILATNDGALAYEMTHPSFHVAKTYLARVKGDISDDELSRMVEGVWLSEGKLRLGSVALVSRDQRGVMLLIAMHEGRNRQIRRVLARLRRPVARLARVGIGDLTPGVLLPGQYRHVTDEEIAKLRAAAHKPLQAQETPDVRRWMPVLRQNPLLCTLVHKAQPGRVFSAGDSSTKRRPPRAPDVGRVTPHAARAPDRAQRPAFSGKDLSRTGDAPGRPRKPRSSTGKPPPSSEAPLTRRVIGLEGPRNAAPETRNAPRRSQPRVPANPERRAAPPSRQGPPSQQRRAPSKGGPPAHGRTRSDAPPSRQGPPSQQRRAPSKGGPPAHGRARRDAPPGRRGPPRGKGARGGPSRPPRGGSRPTRGR